MSLHRDLPDSELHEPKGIASASGGQVYVANGSGSGDWVNNVRFAALRTRENENVIVVPDAAVDPELNTYTDYTKLNIPDLWVGGSTYRLSSDTSSGEITVSTPGVYKVSFWFTGKVDTATENPVTIAFRPAENSFLSNSKCATTLHSGGLEYFNLAYSCFFQVFSERTYSLHAAATANIPITITDGEFMVELMRNT